MPDWDRLYDAAASQAGYFDVGQAREAGYSLPLLAHHIQRGRVQRVRRGVFRLSHFPAGEHEDLVVIWLWSARAGIFSHETALMLHQLSDALPSSVHLTLPAAWQARRLRVPPSVTLHHADVPEGDRTWSGPVPVTAPLRTVADCAAEGAPELYRAARGQALRRGLFTAAALRERVGR